MADHPIVLELFYNGVWNPVSTPVSTSVSQNDPVVVTRGGGEVSDAPRPSKLSCTFEDPDGVYRPYLPTSPLYGLAGRNTPLRLTPGGVFEVASWAPDQTLGYDKIKRLGRQWTEIEAAGLLRRIGGWTEPIASATTRALNRTGIVVDLWALEDQRDALTLTNTNIKGTDGQYRNNGLGDAGSPAGGSTSFRMDGKSEAFGFFSPDGPTDSWQVSFAFKLTTKPSSATYAVLLALALGNFGVSAIWYVWVNNDSFKLDIYDNTGTLASTASVAYGATTPDKWTIIRLQGSSVAGTVTWGIGWATETDSASGISGSVATTFGRPYSWDVNSTPGDYIDGSNWAYIVGATGQTPDLIGPGVQAAFAGYAGETTGTRLLRLAAEEGLTATVQGVSAELMGPQRPDTVLNLFKEIRDTDGGYLVDDPTQVGVLLRSRRSMYAQTPALPLTYGLNVAPPLKPILDDLGTHNLITVTNRGGGSVTVEDTTSPMGSAPPPAGVGKAKQEVAVNLRDDARLAAAAYWWLSLGTLPDVRYSTVTVDLDANPSLEAATLAVNPGDRITITSLDPDVVDLLVISVLDRRANQRRRTVTFTCAPYRKYDVGVYDATTKRYDSKTSTTTTTLTATVTTIVVTFTNLLDQWSTAGVPYDWAIAGERIRVTAMGAVTGTGPWTQSATVTRSINGVPKTHAAGEAVHMHPDQQARYAL